jgi:hypothetical protein
MVLGGAQALHGESTHVRLQGALTKAVLILCGEAAAVSKGRTP